MPRHSETRTLPYSAEQMFDLVADVASYPEFLPWVSAIRVRSDSETDMLADMIVGFKSLKETFTSRVVKARPGDIRVDYVDGPLKYLSNEWRFRDVDASGARAVSSSTSRSISRSRTGCSRCWPGRCSIAHCAR